MQTSCVPEDLRPKIEFPAEDYPLKIIGKNCKNYRTLVEEVLNSKNIKYKQNSIELIPSSNNKYVSLRLNILAESEQQLKSLNQTLIETKKVIMVI